jgi:hypothetical protein
MRSSVRTVSAAVNYIGGSAKRPRYYANDHTRDVLELEPHVVAIEDARTRGGAAPSLGCEGYELLPHRSQVADFRDMAAVSAVHPGEIERLLLDVSGAARVVVGGAGVLRFGEKSPDAGRLNNSLPARFVHVDISDSTAELFAARARPKDPAVGATPRRVVRFAHYNVWRVISTPPQDVPLAVCDARSVVRTDLVAADAVFDSPGAADWSFEGWVVRHNPAHLWSYFSDMHRDEVIVFKTNDSDPREPHCVPHSAFDDPSCPPGTAARASIEMRGTAYWFD